MRTASTRRGYLGAVSTGIATALVGCSAPVGSTTDDASPTRAGTADRPYARVFERTVGSVVLIRTFTDVGVGQGSGFVFPRAGVILTNEHVVRNANALELRFSTGEWRTGETIGTDVYSDLAVVRFDDPPDPAAPLELVRSAPEVGEEVLSIGSPFGFEKSLSVGVISGVNRSLPTEGGFAIPGGIQTDAAVNPGNSGGPLVTLDGRVAGVIRSGGGENIGFAIAAALIERVVPALLERGRYGHPYMGVRLQTVTPSVATANGLDRPRGVLVVGVVPGGPADGHLVGSEGESTVHGVTIPTGGDVIVALDGTSIGSVGDLARYLAFRTRPGDAVTVTVHRDDREIDVELTLGERPPPAQV